MCISISLPYYTSLLPYILSTYAYDILIVCIYIYRCIDYTKVSKGLKLVPKNETINLTEALELPISCMTSIQTRIQITLNTIKSNICEYIISDKQVSLYRLIVIQVNFLIILTLFVCVFSGYKRTFYAYYPTLSSTPAMVRYISTSILSTIQPFLSIIANPLLLLLPLLPPLSYLVPKYPPHAPFLASAHYVA